MAATSFLRLIILVLSVRPKGASAVPPAAQFSSPGDFVIGGLFAIHSNVRLLSQDSKPQIPQCYSFNALGYQRHLGMRFAIEEINNSTSLLPGIRLGYEIHDTCNNAVVTTKPAISFLSKFPGNDGLDVQSSYKDYKTRVIAVVGPGNSDLSVVVARLLGFLSIPEISYASTSDNLSDRELYSSFFRTVPSDRNQVQGMVRLLYNFQWNWVAALATDNEYGRQALEIFVHEALSKDLCVAYEDTLPGDLEGSEREEKLSQVSRQLEKSGSNVTVIFAQPNDVRDLMRVVIQGGITGKVWIASECWATSPNIAFLPNLGRIGTIIGMAMNGENIFGFPEYVRRILADPGPKQNSSTMDGDSEQCPECSSLSLANFSAIVHHPKFYATFNTYKSIYIIAHALHQLLQCNASSMKCNVDRDVYPWQLLEEVARVNFTFNSQPVYFSQTKDLPTGYELVQWNITAPGNVGFVSVGSYDNQLHELSINESKISWNTRSGKPPLSRCTQECEPGQKKWVRGKHNCCYQCEDCPADTFQDRKHAHECSQCPKHQWSPRRSTMCRDRVVEYLGVTDHLAAIMVALTVLALAQVAVVLAVCTKHRDTPAVRSVGLFPTLSTVVSLTCFGSSFLLFVIKPTEEVCKVRQPLFFVSFTISLATLLCKAVQSSGLDQALKKPWLRKHLLTLCILLNVVIQGLLCLWWYIWDAPSLEENTQGVGTILLQCQDISFPGFSLLLAYDYCLAAIGYICSFMRQNNSAVANLRVTKVISFALILILLIWTLFIPAYATSQGKFVPSFQVFAGLASFFAIIGSCYHKVCYVLLFAPHMNTDAFFLDLPPSNPSAHGEPNTTENK